MRLTKKQLEGAMRAMRSPTCPHCEHLLENWCPFCMHCGKSNGGFSILALNAEGYATLEQARKRWCPTWHNLAEGETEKEIDEHLVAVEFSWPFCPICGVELLKVGRQ